MIALFKGKEQTTSGITLDELKEGAERLIRYKIAKNKKGELYDTYLYLVRALLKPVQLRLIANFLFMSGEFFRDRGVNPHNGFKPGLLRSCLPFNYKSTPEYEGEHAGTEVNLGSDIIFTDPEYKVRNTAELLDDGNEYVIGRVGTAKDPYDVKKGDCIVTFFLPMRFGIALGGDHSLSAAALGNGGVTNASAIVSCDQVLSALTKFSYDGSGWKAIGTESPSCEKPIFHEFGLVWELTRLFNQAGAFIEQTQRKHKNTPTDSD